jgi:head-tail adaptor
LIAAVVQRFTASLSPSGEPIETWLPMGPNRWASKTPVAGIERFGSEQLEAKEQVEFQLRWSDDLFDLQPADRIIEPATSTVGRSIYDIFAVLEIGRREGFRILATRRPGEAAPPTTPSIQSGVGLAIGTGGGYDRP